MMSARKNRRSLPEIREKDGQHVGRSSATRARPVWQRRMGVELTHDGEDRRATVLKTAEGRSIASRNVCRRRQIHLCCPSPSTGVRQRFSLDIAQMLYDRPSCERRISHPYAAHSITGSYRPGVDTRRRRRARCWRVGVHMLGAPANTGSRPGHLASRLLKRWFADAQRLKSRTNEAPIIRVGAQCPTNKPSLRLPRR